MRRVLGAALAALTLSAPAMGEIEFRYDDVLTTRFGEVHVEGSDFAKTLWRGTEPLPLPENARWWIDWSAQGEGAYDWVIASNHHGGNSCGGASYILRLEADATAISAPFAGCDGRMTDVRTGDGWIEVDRTDRDITITHVTIRWEGEAYSETSQFAPLAPPAGAGEDVTRWIGQNPYVIFEDAGERARFGQVMEPQDLQNLAEFTSVSAGVSQLGDWVFATGCQPHSCGIVMGAVGIRVSDGAVAAEIRSNGEPARQFGLASDPAFQAAISEGMQ